MAEDHFELRAPIGGVVVQQNVQVLKLDELDDVEIYFHHYSAQRQ